jgi:N-acetylglucosamine-6-phosphate deacetylase
MPNTRRYTLRGARLVDATRDLSAADLTVVGGVIEVIHPSNEMIAVREHDDAAPMQIDASELIVVPGFIDVHTHGGGGHSLQTLDPAEIRAYGRWVTRTGVTSYLIGVVGTPGGLPEAQIQAAVAARRASAQDTNGAEALGIHLEGPFLSERRRGAHLASWLRMPNSEETERLLELAEGELRLLTLAPELEGASALIARMVEAGVTVSMGHTDATYEQAREAIQHGVTHATHCCNAMRPLHHRDPGPLGAVAESPQVQGELIADGIHLHPAMLRLLVKVLGPERVVAVTDALAATGTSETTFTFNGRRARIVSGVARLENGTIAGSMLTMDQALRNVVSMTAVSLPAAVGMLTRNPARAVGAAARKGMLAPGYDADLALLDQRLAVQATIRGGVVIFASDEWRERLAGIVAPL